LVVQTDSQIPGVYGVEMVFSKLGGPVPWPTSSVRRLRYVPAAEKRPELLKL